MNKRPTIVGIAVATALLGGIVILTTAGSGGAATGGLLADHALIDQTGTDTDIWCRATNKQPFTVKGAFQAFGGDVTMRVTFKDEDFVDYPIAQGTSFSLSEAAGGDHPSTRRSSSRRAGARGISWAG